MMSDQHYVQGTEVIHVVWMDGQEATYHAESTKVLEGVLHVYGATRYPGGLKDSDQHFPIANIRRWFKE